MVHSTSHNHHSSVWHRKLAELEHTVQLLSSLVLKQMGGSAGTEEAMQVRTAPSLCNVMVRLCACNTDFQKGSGLVSHVPQQAATNVSGMASPSRTGRSMVASRTRQLSQTLCQLSCCAKTCTWVVVPN
jgi:hypothetical protein